jgi:hypothetical protein
MALSAYNRLRGEGELIRKMKDADARLEKHRDKVKERQQKYELDLKQLEKDDEKYLESHEQVTKLHEELKGSDVTTDSKSDVITDSNLNRKTLSNRLEECRKPNSKNTLSNIVKTIERMEKTW